jgi:Domain of unknown function (DUF5615)
MARFYADEDFDYPVVLELRRLGHNVLTVTEAGQANQRIEDVDVLAFAVAQRRAVLTFNRRDFRRLHRANQAHSGIVICTWDPDRLALAARIHEAVSSGPVLDSQLIRITRPQRQPP